jgi:hypothetical protein
MPASVSGERGVTAEVRAVRSQTPPSAAAPTKPLAAETWAPMARASAAMKAPPIAPAPVWQLQSLRSPFRPSASPMAASSSASSGSVSKDQSPAAKLTRPGAP